MSTDRDLQEIRRRFRESGSFADAAFGVCLLGHDSTLEHRIHLVPDEEGHTLWWSGRIALTYVGDTDPRYRFLIRARGLRFDGFALSGGFTDEGQARALLERWVAHPEAYRLEREGSSARRVPAEGR